MKNMLLILISSCIFGGSCFSQNFLEQGKQWVYEYNDYFGPGFTQTIETITVGNDTVIEGNTYYKMEITENHPCGIFRDVEFLREEGNRIYRRSQREDREFLMIDFAETENYELPYDVKWVGEGSVDTGTAVIDSFGMETAYDGTPFEVQYLHILNNQSYEDLAAYKVYANLGFVQYGLLFPNLSTGLCDVSESVSLRCLISGQDSVRFTEYDCFEIVSSTRDIVRGEVRLYPNPTAGQLTVPEAYTVLRALDISGRDVDYELSGNTLELLARTPGIYFLLLEDNSQSLYTARIIVQ